MTGAARGMRGFATGSSRFASTKFTCASSSRLMITSSSGTAECTADGTGGGVGAITTGAGSAVGAVARGCAGADACTVLSGFTGAECCSSFRIAATAALRAVTDAGAGDCLCVGGTVGGIEGGAEGVTSAGARGKVSVLAAAGSGGCTGAGGAATLCSTDGLRAGGTVGGTEGGADVVTCVEIDDDVSTLARPESNGGTRVGDTCAVCPIDGLRVHPCAAIRLGAANFMGTSARSIGRTIGVSWVGVAPAPGDWVVAAARSMTSLRSPSTLACAYSGNGSTSWRRRSSSNSTLGDAPVAIRSRFSCARTSVSVKPLVSNTLNTFSNTDVIALVDALAGSSVRSVGGVGVIFMAALRALADAIACAADGS